jgi:two-component system sensor histidine kinase DesK
VAEVIMARIRLPELLRPTFDPRCEDPDAAPGAYKGDHPAPPWSLRRAAQNMIWIYASGLVFLLLAVFSLDDDGVGPATVGLRLALIVAIAIGYLLTPWIADLRLWQRWAYVALFLGIVAARAITDGWDFVGYGVYVSVLLAALIPWRQAWIAVGVLNLLIAATFFAAAGPLSIYIAVVGLAVGWTMGGGMETGRIRHRLRQAETRMSTLSLAAERERIGRDLHDILGHSLTAIAIKSDLAGRLVDHDVAAAKAQIAEVTEIARQALGDVRATASAIRQVRVAAELASARSVLMAAGIDARVPSAIEPMPDAESELLGYVVREAVTNVVRHSQATTCTIAVSRGSVTVTDDGVGLSRAAGRGSGITGLTDRLEQAGGHLTVTAAPNGGTVVAATLAAGPATIRAQPVTTGAAS